MDASIVRKRKDCRLCGNVNLELALPMQPSPIGDAYVAEKDRDLSQKSYPLNLYLCMKCSHLQALDVIDPNILFKNYIYSTATSPGLVEHFNQYAKEIVTSINCPSGSFMLEIGSNDGSLLNAFKKNGLKVLGVDPAQSVALQAKEKGLETISDFFTLELAKKIKKQYGEASIIAANNVFAHIDNMLDIMEGIEHLLALDGVFIFEVSYLSDMIEKNVFDTIYHEHVSHHSIAPLEAFFNRYHLQLFDVKRINTKGGSIRGFVKRIQSKREVCPIVKQLIQHESKMGLDKVKTFQMFAENLNKIKLELLTILKDFKAQGKKISGYGASPPVTTTIYQFELGSYIDFLFDDNPIKQGRYSPGHHIPVIPSNLIYEKQPDCIVILAWQYASMIMKKHAKFIENGGTFIVPLPKVKIENKLLSRTAS